MTCIDTHAHVFSKHDQCIKTARYVPNYNATVEDYISRLDEMGFTHGVLIQPSFFGTDNHVMLNAIAQYPDRLKGIAMVDPDITWDALKQLQSQGIVGIRLNLFGLEIPDLEQPKWNTLFTHLEQLQWQVELHASPAYLIKILPTLARFKLNVVIDHFGRVDPVKGISDPAYQQFLDLLDPTQHWVKISGFYRLAQTPGSLFVAKQAYDLLHKKGMLTRLIWGSDWPHTQHEASMSYEIVLNGLRRIVLDIDEQSMILGHNPQQLFQF